jgi:allantoinase
MEPFDLVLAGGDVVADGRVRRLNVGVSGGRVAALSAEPLVGRDRLDAAGAWILPGGVDTHVHFRDPGRTDKEDFETGSRAALAGGFTTVLDIQNNEPFTVDAAAAREKLAIVAPKARTNYGIFGSVGVQNLARLAAMAPFVCAYKAFMTQSVGSLTVTGLGDLLDAMKAVKETGRVLTVHAENDAIHLRARQGLEDHVRVHAYARPRIAEAAAVAEAIELCRETGVRVNLPHLSTGRAATLVRRAKDEGLPISAATCPHYLYFTADDVARGDGLFKVNPSIKFAEDREALVAAVRDGTIDHVHSDHAPHTREEKGAAYGAVPSGIAGIQHQLLVLVDLVARGRLTPPDVARLLAEAPAKAFGLDDVGSIRVGARADLVVADPRAETVVRAEDLLSKAGTSPYVGRTLKGAVKSVVLGGRVLRRDGALVDDGAYGVRVEAVVRD